jgi:hypothetical protein
MLAYHKFEPPTAATKFIQIFRLLTENILWKERTRITVAFLWRKAIVLFDAQAVK